MILINPVRRDRLEAFIKDRRTIRDFEQLSLAAIELQSLVGALTPLVIVKSEPAIVTPTVATTFKTVSSLTLLKANLKQGMWIEAGWSGRYKLGAAETIQISILDRGSAIIAGLSTGAGVGPANVTAGYHYGAVRFQIADPAIDAAVPVLPGGLIALSNSDGLMRAVGADARTTFPSGTVNADFNADGAITLSVKFGTTSALNGIDFGNVYWSIFTPGA